MGRSRFCSTGKGRHVDPCHHASTPTGGFRNLPPKSGRAEELHALTPVAHRARSAGIATTMSSAAISAWTAFALAWRLFPGPTPSFAARVELLLGSRLQRRIRRPEANVARGCTD